MKAIRLVGYTFGGLSAAYAGYYTVLYLTRWEWQRALISAALLIVVEVFLATVLLLTRLSRLEERLERSDARVEEVRKRLEQTRGSVPNHFNWLAAVDRTELNGTHRTFVFVPVLMVAGAALSGIAMVIQKVAGATARPGAERRLAGRLAALTAPPITATVPLESLPAVPAARTGRGAFAVVAAVGGLLLVPVLWSALADATQTRAEQPPDAASTTMVFRVETYGDRSEGAVQLAARDLWETCRRSTAATNDNATLNRMNDGVYAGVIRPALPPHDVTRLHGCLQDANTNRTSAVVLGEGQSEHRS
ncbi:hypothetical protein PV396_37750 [Streptomyces sp. ME02-8801-2C]|uniref:hypothetical protein n=1 Tax=Streptomyces sp. ME02-8801-2C TaxID=3028680 RepID=UPI0029B54CE9|nr:hypothetical protein [Streptomyces sp. ME02-8801-2C]MDX3457634.1 hypothetical protein [Streptomyces sp. ME02-8801-2C]